MKSLSAAQEFSFRLEQHLKLIACIKPISVSLERHKPDLATAMRTFQKTLDRIPNDIIMTT